MGTAIDIPSPEARGHDARDLALSGDEKGLIKFVGELYFDRNHELPPQRKAVVDAYTSLETAADKQMLPQLVIASDGHVSIVPPKLSAGRDVVYWQDQYEHAQNLSAGLSEFGMEPGSNRSAELAAGHELWLISRDIESHEESAMAGQLDPKKS